MTKSIMPIGLGTAAIGRPQYINIRQELTTEFSLEAFRNQGMQVLDEAYNQGIRYFDTAPGYGLAEQLLIDWVMDKNDENIEVATKWGYTYIANFDSNAKVHEVKEHSLDKLNEQWLQSEKLIPALSIYQIHSATFDTGVLENKEVLHWLAMLKNEHNLLMGITTSGGNQTEVIKRALEIEIEGIPLFDAFQVTYNPLDQSLAKIASELSNRNKKIIIKEALANGRIFPNNKYPHYFNLYKKLQDLANKYETGIDAIALRFCIDGLNPFKVLSGAANKSHITDNLKAIQFELEEEDIIRIKEMAIPPEDYWEERKQLGWN